MAAGLTSLGLMGNYTLFRHDPSRHALATAWIVPVVAVAGGSPAACSAASSSCSRGGLPGRLGRLVAARPILFAAACGLAVALCGLASGGSVYGTGYEEARAILHGDAPASPLFAPLKFLATVLSSVSGIPAACSRPRWRWARGSAA